MRVTRSLLCLVAASALACGGQGSTARGVGGADARAQAAAPATYSVADVYQNTRFRGIAWSADSRTVLVSSDLSGIWNAYAIARDGGEPRPLTHSTVNSMFALSYFPADDRFLYSSDQGGNELTHVYVQAPDGSTKDLTPGEKLKANFLGWAGDDRSFFVSTNERDPKYFDVYQIAVDGYRRTMFYRNADGFDVGPISRDQRYIALSKARSTSDADIFLYDRTTKKAANVTPHTGAVNNTPADFSPDGARLLYTSNEGSEFASLRSLGLADRSSSPVYQEQWDITGARYSKSGKYLLVAVDDDSRSVYRVLDATTLKPAPVTLLPAGSTHALTISRDDSAVAYYATDGSTPDDLYAGPVGSHPQRITNALNPRIRREDLVVPTVARFKSYDGVEVPGLLYMPHQASPQAKAPALVMVHGGPGDQATVAYRALTQALANHGYVVYDINNRGSSGYGKTFFEMDDRRHGEADLGDVVASKAMLVATGKVDPDRIGIIGGSYGGYMVLAALTLQPDAFKAGVDLFGISNWIRTLESIPPWWGARRDALYAEMGDPRTDAARLRRISPLFNAEKIKAPLMVLQGANDPRVLKVESDEIVAAARKNGVPVEYVVFPDEGHGFVKKENEIKGYSGVIAFLDAHLKQRSAVATQ
jgi:dipeptidyl aminopeptidase/acylaminoacyl peptidase